MFHSLFPPVVRWPALFLCSPVSHYFISPCVSVGPYYSLFHLSYPFVSCVAWSCLFIHVFMHSLPDS